MFELSVTNVSRYVQQVVMGTPLFTIPTKTSSDQEMELVIYELALSEMEKSDLLSRSLQLLNGKATEETRQQLSQELASVSEKTVEHANMLFWVFFTKDEHPNRVHARIMKDQACVYEQGIRSEEDLEDMKQVIIDLLK